MAALSVLYPTLLDMAKRMDPDGKVDSIAEILNETNEILDEMTWVEGNLPTGHRSTMRTGIPTPTWRKINQGVQPTKSTTRQTTFNCGMLEAYAEIDKALADLNGNTAAWRLSEERPFMEGISQELADTVIYGNEGSEPEAFTGLTPYYNLSTAESGDNLILGGGSGSDNASIWLVVWGPHIHGIIPKGSKAGLQMSDKGLVTIEDASGGSNTGRMEAYRTHYRFDAGLAVRDWRYAVRICNIDKSELTRVYTSGTFSTGANLPDLMFQAMRRVPSLSAGRASFYMSRDIATWVARQTAALGYSTIPANAIAGDRAHTERFNGIPMRRVDAMAADEALVA